MEMTRLQAGGAVARAWVGVLWGRVVTAGAPSREGPGKGAAKEVPAAPFCHLAARRQQRSAALLCPAHLACCRAWVGQCRRQLQSSLGCPRQLKTPNLVLGVSHLCCCSACRTWPCSGWLLFPSSPVCLDASLVLLQRQVPVHNPDCLQVRMACLPRRIVR